MVANIGIGDNLYGVLVYNYQKVAEKEAKIIGTSRLSVNDEGTLTFGECFRDFLEVLPLKTRCRNTVLHVSLNPHPKDKLSDEQLESIGREYMEELGYGEQPFIIFKHEDIAREHIHIVSLRVDAMGKKINDSFEHRRSKAITDKLEKKYQLHAKNEGERLSFEEVKKVDIQKGNLKKQIAGVVLPLMKTYRFQTLGEWNALLSQYGLKAEEVKGEHRGNSFTGLLYTAINEKGEALATPIKSSRIGKSVGAKALQEQYVKSKDWLKERTGSKNRIRGLIRDTMQFSPNQSEFLESLKTEGVAVVLRENANRRLYGMTFIDHKEKVVLNGSRLGKAFSANVFHEYFNGNGQNPFLSEEVDKEVFKQHLSTTKNKIESEDETLLEALLPDETGLLEGLPTHGIDYKELAFIKKMRRLHSGKKRGRKR